MKYSALILLVFTFFVSCREKTHDKETIIEDEVITDHPVKETEAVTSECYMKITGKDTIKVNFTRNGDSIDGIYHNLHYGMDKRRSTFKGTLINNKANTISNYSSEGEDYTEELSFSIKGNMLHLNYGATEKDEKGVWRYKAATALSEYVLPKVECK